MSPVKSRSSDHSRRGHVSAFQGQTPLASTDSAEQELARHEAIPVLAMLPDVSHPPKSQESVKASVEGKIVQKNLPEEIAEPAGKHVASRPASDVALDLVLNEIVLQARLTTNATGVVLGLGTSGALVCRGTTGATAPDVAAYLNTKSGIAATCFETGAVQRVDDLGPDENADAVAYRRGGALSILAVPVQGEKGPILGILEIFSPRTNAFCERDVFTLQALARRIATNVELVRLNRIEPGSPENGPIKNSHSFSRTGEKLSKTDASKKLLRFLPGVKSSRLWTLLREKGKSLGAIDWIPVMAKTASGLLLTAASISAVSCWQHGGGTQLVQAIRGPLQLTSKSSEAHPPRPVTSASPQVRTTIPSNDSPLSPKTQEAASSNPTIIIQRQPVHKPNSSQSSKLSVAAEPSANKASSASDLVLFEDRKKEEKARTAGDSSAKNAPTLAPDIESLDTQAAMARLVQRIEPEYPNAARQQHIQGTVMLDVVVGINGAVDTISLVSGNAQLMPAAADAVRQWHFQPLVKNGQPKKFESRLPIDFVLAFEGSGPSH